MDLEQAMADDSRDETLRVLSWNIGRIYLCRPPLNRIGAIRRLLNDDMPSERDLEHIVSALDEHQPKIAFFYELPSGEYLEQIAQHAAASYVPILGPRKPIKPKKPYHHKYVGALVSPALHPAALLLVEEMALDISISEAPGMHIIGYHGAYNDAARRREEIAGINRHIPGLYSSVVLVGDFNAWRWHVKKEERKATFALFNLLSELGYSEASWRIPYTTVYGIAVDHVFKRRVEVDCRIDVQARKGFMDHYPLIVGVHLPVRQVTSARLSLP